MTTSKAKNATAPRGTNFSGLLESDMCVCFSYCCITIGRREVFITLYNKISVMCVWEGENYPPLFKEDKNFRLIYIPVNQMILIGGERI